MSLRAGAHRNPHHRHGSSFPFAISAEAAKLDQSLGPDYYPGPVPVDIACYDRYHGSLCSSDRIVIGRLRVPRPEIFPGTEYVMLSRCATTV